MRNAIWTRPAFTYNLTERLSTYLAYDYNMVDYQVGIYSNYQTNSINQRFNYLWNEKITFITAITAYFARYQSGNTYTALGPQVGFSHKFSEKWDMTLLGGFNINKIKSNVGVLSFDNNTGFITVQQAEQTSTSVTPFITLATSYKWEKGNLSLNYTRNQSANAYGNQSQYNNFYLNINQGITEKLSLKLVPYFYSALIDNPGSDYNSTIYGVRPGLSYKLTERTSLGANYGFAYRTVTGSSDYSFPIHNVWLTLTYTYPLHYQY